jgi:hypothetical protein
MFGIEYRQNKDVHVNKNSLIVLATSNSDKTVGESLKSKGFKDEILKFICVHLLY